MITIRWRAIFEPICWLLGHDVETIHGASSVDVTVYRCKRCVRRKKSWKIDNVIRYGYSYRYLVWIDWEGRELSRTLQATNDPNPQAFYE